LIPEILDRGYKVELLSIGRHGPYFDTELPGLKIIDLKTDHVNSSLFAVVKYLKTRKPLAMLSDKDRVNRLAVIANAISGTNTRLVLRSGTTLSVDLESRGWLQKKTQIWSVKTLYSSAFNIVTPSQGSANDLINLGKLDSKKVNVIPSPVISPDLFKLSSQSITHKWLGENKQYPVILGIGELSYRKDFHTLIRAFALIQKTHPSRLIILGKGKQKDHLRELCQELCIQELVDFAGFQDNPYPWFRECDIFALTSRWEGMPVVLIEALALGKSSIATDCPSGPSEILQGGTLGPLIPIEDYRQFANGIIKLLESPKEPSLLQESVSKYTVSNSTTGYLKAMGLKDYAQ